MTPLVEGLVFPECPRWRGGSLWFSDMHGRKIHNIDLAGAAINTIDFPGKPAGLGWLPGGDMLVVSMEERALYRVSERGMEVHASLAGHHLHESNDMVVDARGNAFIGSLGFDFHAGESIAKSSIVRVSVDRKVSIGADGLLCPNGLAITSDRTTLVVAETFGSRLTAYRINENGDLGERRTFARLGEHAPDGICIDAEDHIWVAACVNHECLRINPMGDVVDRIYTGTLNPFACQLGGDDGKRLFICCARNSNPRETHAARAGMVGFVDVDVAAPLGAL